MFTWFEKNMTCKDSSICDKKIITKLKTEFPNLKNDLDNTNFYLRIIHQQNNHMICIGICEKDGEINAFRQNIEYPLPNKKYDILIKHTVNLTITDKHKWFPFLKKTKKLIDVNADLGHNIYSELITDTTHKKYTGTLPTIQQFKTLLQN